MRCKIIIPSSGTVELMDDVDISLTFQIADIKDPQKRHADYSKTITVPGSHNNNKMFQHIFDIGIDRLYNPNKKANCLLMADSTTIMKGYMRLKNIINVDGKLSYEIEITGRLADLFTILGDAKIKDLSWSDLDHTYSRPNQIASWSATPGSGYIYPFIDYGFTTNEIDYEVDDFFPGIYVKEIWERIMSWAGFQVTSPTSGFFTSNYWKRLFLPFTGDKLRLTNAQIEARRFQASNTAATNYTTTYTTPVSATYSYYDIIFNDDSTSPNQDTGGVYNTANGIWTCGASGYYNVNTNLIVRTWVNVSSAGSGYIEQDVIFRLIDITNANPQIALYSQLQIMSVPVTATGTTYYTSFVNFNVSTNNSPVFISAGTQVKVQAMVKGLDYSTGATITNIGFQVSPGGKFYNQVDPEIKEGDTVTIANCLPQEMTMKEFVNGIIKMHNIYTEYDKDVPNKLIMEPRNSFYGTTVQDWTQKRDLSRELEIVPMGALQARYYKFTYKEDKDYYNAKYLNENGAIYGERKITVDNDFLVNTYTEQLPFSPTPMDSSSASALNVQAVGSEDRYFPKIINRDQQGKVSPRVSNPRILYYGGLRQCKPWNYNSNTLASSGVTNYPFCGHMDDPITPTLDLNFGLTKEVYYEPAFNATISNNNLYNKYWKQEIDEITDKNSSIVTGWFRLTPKDIALVDFSHIYRFDFQNFRLNKIIDYNPLKEGLTKCEFIKVKLGVPFTAATANLNGSSNPISSDDENPVPLPKPVGKPGKNLSGGVPIGNTISGKFNTVPISATGISITGDYNVIGENGRNVTIINSSGCVVPGNVSEVVIINSSGVTVTTSNTIIINNAVSTSVNYWTKVGNDIYSNNTGDVRSVRYANFAALGLRRANGSEATPTIVSSGNNVGDVEFSGYDGANYIRTAIIRSSVSGTPALTKVGGNLRFFCSSEATPSVLTEYLQITSDGRIYATNIHNNSGSVTGTTNQYIASGTYSASVTNETNTGTTSITGGKWMRVGNIVNASFRFSTDPTGVVGDFFYFDVSLPIASAISNSHEVNGTAYAVAITNRGCAIYGEPSGNTARVYGEIMTTSAQEYTAHFQYEVL